ncbi:MAG: hypothetical protein JXN59_14360 [Anaerolineae bacterium]|nr:hypothetical protein [Anaerolineae bacterium]
MNKVESPIFFILLLAILIPLEVFCALLAYETLGEVMSGTYIVGIILLNGLLVALFFRHRAAAMLGVLGVALLIVPYQVVLADRLIRVQAEATRIVAYAYETRAETGDYPADLIGYTFTDTDMQPYIQSYTLSDDGSDFTVYYFVGSDTASHWYGSDTGWDYYPD